MFAKCAGITALLWAVSGSVAAQHVSDRTAPLPDPHVQGFYFVADDLVMAAEFKDKDVVLNGYDLGRAAALWRQQIRVRESDKSPGGLVHIAPSQDRVYLGNGPLTVIDPATGRTLWSLDCKAIGSFDFNAARFYSDGSFLITGTEGCGELNNLRVMSIDDVNGAVRWQAPARPHTYKAGNVEHWDFDVEAWLNYASMIDNTGPLLPAPENVVVSGERLFSIDYATGRQTWGLRDEPGRHLPLDGGDLSLWIKDDKLAAYNVHTGGVQWSYDLKAPWAMAYLADPQRPDSSDLLLFTYYGAHRLNRATGRPRWSIKRQDGTWGQAYSPPLVILAQKIHDWDALDPATGEPKWHLSISDRHWRRVDSLLSVAATGIVLFAEFEHLGDVGPWTLVGIDAATGNQRWKLDRALGADIDDYLAIDSSIVVMTDEGWASVDVHTGALTPIVTRESRHSGTIHENGLSYSKKTKTLTYRAADGHVVWTRPGEQSENAAATVTNHDVVVFPQQNGKVEFIALETGTTLLTLTGNAKPMIGVDRVRGRVLLPEGNKLHIASISQ